MPSKCPGTDERMIGGRTIGRGASKTPLPERVVRYYSMKWFLREKSQDNRGIVSWREELCGDLGERRTIVYEVVFVEPRRVEIREVPIPKPGPGEVLLKILYSGISHGTEMNWYRGTVPHRTKVIRDGLFVEEDTAPASYPNVQGYEEVGDVVAIGEGVHTVKLGERYATVCGHRQYALVDPTQAYFHRLPQNLDPKAGIFLALGGVAFDALLSAGIRLGESAAIFGQGVVGLLLTHLCRLAGVRPIIGIDPLPSRLAESLRAGAHHTLTPDRPDLAQVIRAWTRGKGVDVAFEMSGSYQALHQAFRVTANPFGTVVAGGFYQGEAKGLNLGEEFHHSTHKAGGATRMIALHERIESDTGPWGLRRVLETVWRLIVESALPVEGLITHVVPATRADEAFRLIDEHPEQCLKVILDMQQ